jgi:hypothetical protein
MAKRKSEPTRRSSRVAALAAEQEAKMHEEALAATKDWFAEMGREMQQAEDQEAAEMFGKAVLEKEEATGLVCVMLENVEDDSDSDADSDDDAESDAEEDPEAEPSEVSASEDEAEADDDDDESDDDWAPDGMKERLERALKVFVPPEAAEALETAQLTMTMAEAAPGAAPELAEKLVAAAETAKDPAAAFAAAFAATVAMAEADAARTWAANKKNAQGLLTRLGAVWRGVLATESAAKAKAKARVGIARLEPECRSALETFLGERLPARWGEGTGEEGEKPLGLTFDCVGGAGSSKGKKRARE